MVLRSHLHSRDARPSATSMGQSKRSLVSNQAWKSLDRVQVLDGDYAHDGCVNALSWIDSQTLASSGDDTRVHFWRLNTATDDYQFDCTGILRTGHRSNIFNVQYLPGSSSHIVTCARDRQVRVFDVSRAWQPDMGPGSSVVSDAPVRMETDSACIRVFKCHSSDVKRVVVDGATQFMTVSEDGSARHHDLRAPHICSRDGDSCPPPLIRVNFPLSALTSSVLRPWYIVVAGESPYGFLYDRRALGRRTEEEWGIQLSSISSGFSTCVRRYGRAVRRSAEMRGREHITGARLSNENSEELLLSYHADAVYRYFLHDDPLRDRDSVSPLPSRKRRRLGEIVESTEDPDDDDSMTGEGSSSSSSRDEETGENEEEWETDEEGDDLQDDLRVPIILPRTRYQGAANMATVKDVNFLGHRDEYVVSGSDDGNWFMWDKDGQLQGIWEGDGSVVNVIESHPSLPLVATSGIDETVKIFAPSTTRNFSRMDRADEIVAENTTQRPRQRTIFLTPADLLRYHGVLQALAGEENGEAQEGGQCVHQ